MTKSCHETSACDVTSGNVLGDRFCVSGKGRLVGVPEECKHCMAMSGLGFRKVLVGNGWAISLLLCMI